MTEFWMLVGVAGSGKTTIAKKLAKNINGKIFSSDDIREEIYGDASIQDNPGKVFDILHRRVKEALKKGESVIYDACNLNAKRRKTFLQEIKKYNCFKFCLVVTSDFESCVKNQEKRDRKVPKEVIKRQIKNFELPNKDLEGWDLVLTTSPFHNFSLEEELIELTEISHDNPHHSLTIGEHMLKAEALAKEDQCPDFVIKACRYHDIGKGFCKEFCDYKGNPTEIAHYYGHQNVSAYMILSSKEFADNNFGGYIIAEIVQHHMAPFLMSEEKFKNKYGSVPFLNAYIELIHKYDIEAH